MKTDNILGIGNDIIEIDRVRKSIEEHGKRFLERLFTPKEQSWAEKYRDPTSYYAGRFCAKEAIVKALGVGIGAEASWQDIEIFNDEKGKPIAFLSLALIERFQNPQILVSISHCKQYASSVALWIGSQG
jgi:holo-[acyl-carrier protein] synthase